MTTVLSIILFVIFSSLGFIHFYWLFGGKWELEKVLPTKEIGEKAIEPPKIATTIVGIGLISFGLIYLIKTGLRPLHKTIIVLSLSCMKCFFK